MDNYENPEYHLPAAPYPTEACFQLSKIIECDGKKDKRKCTQCGREWTTTCNFDADFS